jgi:hypothetical protein
MDNGHRYRYAFRRRDTLTESKEKIVVVRFFSTKAIEYWTGSTWSKNEGEAYNYQTKEEAYEEGPIDNVVPGCKVICTPAPKPPRKRYLNG